MLPLEIIRKYYPDLSDEDLMKIQEFIYQLCCGIMQHFHGEDWDEDIDELSFENKKDWFSNPNISSNPDGVLSYRIIFEEFSINFWG